MKTYLLAAVALSLTTPALASNLVTNGSFKTVGAGFTGKTGFFGNVTPRRAAAKTPGPG